jgi:Gluconate 2-dehydrogenase subunit 3
MNPPNKARRAFLFQSAAGMGAVAAAGLSTDAKAQESPPATPMPAMAPSGAPAMAQEDNALVFFNVADALTIEALAERIMPGAPGKPGAKDAGVLTYIDLALSGAYSDQQEFYRHGLAQLDTYCNTTYNNSFTYLTSAQQDEVVTALETGKATGFDWPTAQSFFDRARTHTMEGMFADPVYGGNKNFAGWRLVGFPGAQVTFTPEDLASSGPFTRAAIIGM